MQIKLATDKYDIISTGSVIIPNDEVLEFRFENLRFKCSFEEEKDDNGNLTPGHVNTFIENEGTPDAYMIIRIYNQINSFFASSNSMFSLARLNRRELLFKFSIQSINAKKEGTEDKIFFYTWYLRKENAISSPSSSDQA